VTRGPITSASVIATLVTHALEQLDEVVDAGEVAVLTITLR